VSSHYQRTPAGYVGVVILDNPGLNNNLPPAIAGVIVETYFRLLYRSTNSSFRLNKLNMISLLSLTIFAAVASTSNTHAFLLPGLSMVRNVKPSAGGITRAATTDEDARAVIETYKSGISESRSGKPNRNQTEKVRTLLAFSENFILKKKSFLATAYFLIDCT
jgi:hypothetical protein